MVDERPGASCLNFEFANFFVSASAPPRNTVDIRNRLPYDLKNAIPKGMHCFQTRTRHIMGVQVIQHVPFFAFSAKSHTFENIKKDGSKCIFIYNKKIEISVCFSVS